MGSAEAFPAMVEPGAILVHQGFGACCRKSDSANYNIAYDRDPAREYRVSSQRSASEAIGMTAGLSGCVNQPGALGGGPGCPWPS